MNKVLYFKLLDLYKFLMNWMQRIFPSSITKRIALSNFQGKIYNIEANNMLLNKGLVDLSLGKAFEPPETAVAKQLSQNDRVIAFKPSPANFEVL